MEYIGLRHGKMRRFPAGDIKFKPAVIICPGGGYEFCSIREGAPVGRKFAEMGIEAFVLDYECAPVPLKLQPLHTLALAVKHVRENSDKYGIDKDKIVVGGFSAGAHLAGLLGTKWSDTGIFGEKAEREKIRPNAMVLCYPVITAGEYAHRGSFERLAGKDTEAQKEFSIEAFVTKNTPPTFLWHTMDDATVPVENTLLMEAALRREGVPHELHLFGHGVHGLSLADLETYDPIRGRLPDRHVASWVRLCAQWVMSVFNNKRDIQNR